MNFKYLILLTGLIALLSLAAVAAGENNTDEAVTSDEKCDLSVDIKVDEFETEEGKNRKGSPVLWTVTAKAKNGTAYNTRVNVEMSDNMKFLAYRADSGSYDDKNGIWDVGNLASSNETSLYIYTLLKKDGRFTLSINATSDSDDSDLTNNYQSKSIESVKTNQNPISGNPYKIPKRKDPSKKPSYTTTTSNNKGASHTSHYGSDSYEGIAKREVVDESAAPSMNGTDSSKGSLAKSIPKSAKSIFNSYIWIIPLLLLMAVTIVGYRRFKS